MVATANANGAPASSNGASRSSEPLTVHEAVKGELDIIFGGSSNKAWLNARDRLVALLPPCVPSIVRDAQLKQVRIEPVLSTEGFGCPAVQLARVLVPSALLAGVGWALGLPYFPVAAAIPLTWLGLYLPSLDPTLFALSRLTGLGYELDAGGVDFADHTLVVRPRIGMNDSAFPRAVAHEMLHVVDIACGGPQGLAVEPEFIALYEAVVADPSKAPTPYALKSARELFTEVATAYLGLGHGTSSGLRERNPELWQYYNRLFRERLPEIAAKRSVRPAAEWQVDFVVEISQMHPSYREPLRLLFNLGTLLRNNNGELTQERRDSLTLVRDEARAYLASRPQVPKTIAFKEFGPMVTDLRSEERRATALLAR